MVAMRAAGGGGEAGNGVVAARKRRGGAGMIGGGVARSESSCGGERWARARVHGRLSEKKKSCSMDHRTS